MIGGTAGALDVSGPVTLVYGGGFIEATGGFMLNTNNGAQCYLFSCNLLADTSVGVITNATTDRITIANSIGTIAQELVSFAAAAIVTVANSTFISSSTSGNWATGIGGLIFGNVDIIGTSQNLPATIVASPLTPKPNYLYKSTVTANTSMATNRGYYVTSGALNMTLPTTAYVGDTIAVTLYGGTFFLS